MALFNYATKEITLKIVYYGPGLSGKTTNLQYLHASVLQPESTGKLLSLATESDRTLFFDFLPVELGKIREFTIRFQLYTVPGQVRYNATRKVVLKGADAVVFVADSQKDMREQNIESFDNMRENLVSNNINPDEIPVVLQFNKRDLKNISSVEEINEYLNPYQYPVVESKAISGAGVEETFKLITRLMLKYISKKHKIEIQQPAQEKDTAGSTPAVSVGVPAEASIAVRQPVARPEPETAPLPQPLTVEEAIEIFPDEGDEAVEVAEEYEQEAPEPVFELPDVDQTAPPYAFSPSPPNPEFQGESEPLPLYATEPESIFEQTPEPEPALPSEPIFEQTPEPEPALPSEPVFEQTPEPEPALPSEPVFERTPEPEPKSRDELMTTAVLPGVIDALRDDIQQIKESLQELQKIGTLIEGLGQTNGILTDLKNTVYILSKEVRELKEIHRDQEETNSLLRSMASTLEGLKETNSLLRSMTSTFEGLKKSKGWLKF